MLRLLAVAFILLVTPVGASLVEEYTGGDVAYQFDGGTYHDAPDTCAELLASPHEFSAPLGNRTDGILIPPDDEVDHFRMTIAPDVVGERVHVFVSPQKPDVEVSLDVFIPACGSSASAEENQPATPPIHPAPTTGQKQVAPANLETGDCGDQWRFKISKLNGLEHPLTIHAVWTDGSEADVVLDQSGNGEAKYSTREHLAYTLSSVSANVPQRWDGLFSVHVRPCDAQDGHAVFGEPSTSTSRSISFTPTLAGDFIVAIRFVAPDVEETPQVPTSIPLTCHFCVGMPDDGSEPISYFIDSFKTAN